MVGTARRDGDGRTPTPDDYPRTRGRARVCFYKEHTGHDGLRVASRRGRAAYNLAQSAAPLIRYTAERKKRKNRYRIIKPSRVRPLSAAVGDTRGFLSVAHRRRRRRRRRCRRHRRRRLLAIEDAPSLPRGYMKTSRRFGVSS